MLSVGDPTCRIHDKGTDEKMGRWSWTRFQGLNGRMTRFISAYRLVKNPNGPSSVWNQHVWWINSNNCTSNPHKLFEEDLLDQLSRWINDGEQIWLGMDVNENAITGDFAQALKDLGLNNLHASRHDQGTLPPTCSKAKTPKPPIDGIFVTWSPRNRMRDVMC